MPTISLCLVLHRDAIAVSIQSSCQFYGVDSFDNKRHRQICECLINFCEKRLPQDQHHFHIRAVQQGAKNDEDRVRFGAAVMIDQGIHSADELSALRLELSDLSKQLQDNNSNLYLNFEEQDPKTVDARWTAMQEAITELRAAHGGERLKHPLQIVTDDSVIAELKTEILSRPDVPGVEIPETVNGLIDKYTFSSNECKISAEGKGKRRTSLRAYISDKDVRTAAIDLGLSRTAASIRLRRIGEDGAMLEITGLTPISGMPPAGQ